MTGGVSVRYDERAPKTAHSLDRRFFLVLRGSATSPVISAGDENINVNMHAVHNFTVVMSSLFDQSIELFYSASKS